MEQGQLSWIANFIWGIADDVLRDLYVRGKYRDVILPMTVLRRLDAVLEPTKQAVLDMKASLDRAGIVHQDVALRQAAGQAFYNTSKFTLRDLKNRASQQQLKADFAAYLDGYSPNVQEILENFEFRNQIPRLSKADALGTLIEKFLETSINLSPNPVPNGDGSVKHPGLDNHAMGTIFEELVRRFNEENNEEAGEHWTPRDAVKLMAKLVFLPIAVPWLGEVPEHWEVGTLRRKLSHPSPEQAAIVRFLDHADRRIRRYIRAKQKLIKLLEEQEQATVHRAVTRGLDPNVRLKPSGVEWLGDVPTHWKVLPIKRAFISMDYGISKSAIDAGTIRLLTMGNIKNGQVTIPETGGVAAVDASLLLDAGDLLFNRTNSSELVGKVGLLTGADSPVTFASYLVRMRPRPEHEPEYLNAVLNDVSVLSIARRQAIPSLHQSNLNPTRYGRLQVALPILDEQRAILQALKSKTHDLEKAISAAHREIALLREYRTRLIADVVTGKLDVREAAARLPEEAEEPNLLDEADTLTNAEEDAADDLDAVSEEAGT